MANDKTFNEKPMLVVVADGLDPRVQRQLKAQLHSELMNISQVEAEIKNQEASENIKQQLDSVKDESKFDDNNTKDQAPPTPVEDNANADTGQTPDADGESGSQGQAAGADSGEDPFTGENGGENAEPNKPPENASSTQEGDAQPQQPAANTQTPPTQDTSPPTTDKPPAEDNPFTGEGENPNGNGTAAGGAKQQPQQPDTKAPTQPAANQANGSDTKDPFTDETPTFEAFAGILGLSYKQEDAQNQTKAETPPMKQFVYLRGTDQGVDQRTSAVVAALEDPQNTVVVIDLSDVGEVESKMQFSSLKKQLQERGITVVETVEQAVDFLNDVYDQISGGSND